MESVVAEPLATQAGLAQSGAEPKHTHIVPCTDYPLLTARHVKEARLYCDRSEMFRSLGIRPGPVFGEIGVALGWFSEFILQHLDPSEFVVFDLFDLHTIPVLWGRATSEIFLGKTHLEYYRDKFSGSLSRMVIEVGSSHETLLRYPDRYFDVLYIDADHTYDGVKRDAELAKTRIKRDGLLVFNDYIMMDHLSGDPYGVIPVVNELIVQEDWQVVAFALQHQMFCDIAIRPRTRD
ncbi:MAG: class I SAM-dependent methyltransferase [Acetobacteraceae bacterium]